MNTQKIEELEATIALAQQQIEELKKPKIERFKPEHETAYANVMGCGGTSRVLYDCGYDQKCYDFFNCYETKELAEKAALLMRRSNAVIMAKMLVEADFEPDWDDRGQIKWSVYYAHDDNEWLVSEYTLVNDSVAHVSTQEKAEQMCKLLTEWGCN